ncbi:type II toxin-antitoxin system HicB family antitoxin (plasmid) [Halorientalis pallida]|uniref:type II toxin-antitoxin system HicB family antitoxin n=1 Tax=Halorientalis pallida TaxID=2479928 RepID=UPI003C6F478C
MSKERGDGGRYTATIDDETILHFFESGQRDFYSAQEVAAEFELDRSQAHRRLSKLSEADEIERVEVGRRNVVWWRPRDVVVLVEDDEGYASIDSETGVASQGATRPEALRMLAEAIEVSEGKSEMTPEEIYAELELDPDEVDADASPPWD